MELGEKRFSFSKRVLLTWSSIILSMCAGEFSSPSRITYCEPEDYKMVNTVYIIHPMMLT